MTKPSLYEQLAAIEHTRWADWQSYLHRILRSECPSSELEHVLARWDRQIATPYSDLSESEKQFDRNQVNRYWALITEHRNSLNETSTTITRTYRSWVSAGMNCFMRWKCFFGFHDWETDEVPINGFRWRFCKRCGGRQVLIKCGASDTWQWLWS